MVEQIKLADAKLLIKQHDMWVAAKDAEIALVELEESAAQSIQQVVQTWRLVGATLDTIVLPDDEEFENLLDTIL